MGEMGVNANQPPSPPRAGEKEPQADEGDTFRTPQVPSSGLRPPSPHPRGEGKTLMIAGGGTGGHIYPAIAIAREFLARDASRRVVFVGTEYGLEKSIVPKAGFPLEFISVGGLKGKGSLDLAKNLLRLPLGFFQASRVVGKHKPNAVLGVGGYASG